MRFSVRRRLQNALFRRVRFSSPGQTSGRLTEKRTLYPPPHGKAHSVPTASRKGALCPTGGLQDALLRETPVAECAFSSHRACRMRFFVECAFPHLGKRRAASRKGALCADRLTERRTLYRLPHGKTHSAQPAGYRMRFSVRHGLQDVSFRNSRLGCRRQGWPLLSVGSAAV